MSFRRGRRLGIDVGSVRVGVAYCDPDGILATPLATVYRRDGDERALREIRDLINEVEPIEIVCGKPKTLRGQEGKSAATALEFTRLIAETSGVPIRLFDERFTTTEAHRMLQSAGRNSRQRRERVDAVAAVVILQSALEAEKTTGSPAGDPLPHESQPPGGDHL
ncbi:Holliday junction resolvase RuvX [Brevibacterium sp. 50QC2O2]|uniref:Holliday junction resolvase RuvX n=1 Tax=Brevibacterium TaxID=1696 RepID=UPI00211C4C01|nr:Holliday junction resolvase RuvX [Brevibacterium sp. 91QC2O2]MCQ9384049.1 Holliday junction resolvase RuvX [Brevibacterium sp. 68QC2CO]MCQ9389097.1 Holliday junction resolvase RuvX [Brevibacterium sp. 50QC2O2]